MRRMHKVNLEVEMPYSIFYSEIIVIQTAGSGYLLSRIYTKLFRELEMKYKFFMKCEPLGQANSLISLSFGKANSLGLMFVWGKEGMDPLLKVRCLTLL